MRIEVVPHDPQQALSRGKPDATRTQHRSITLPKPTTPAPREVHAAEVPAMHADILTYRPGQPVQRAGQMPSFTERRRAYSPPAPAKPGIVRIK